MKNPYLDTTTSQKYGTIFCIFLVVIAVLYRDNSVLINPQFTELMAGLLLFNLVASLALKKQDLGIGLVAFSVLINCGLITAILNYSGGYESNLWVLYLLPIYTACLLLEGAEVALILLGILLFNVILVFFTVDASTPQNVFNLFLKVGFFIFASAFTWHIVRKDRLARKKINAQRAEIAEMETKMKEVESLADIGQITSGVTHDLGSPLAVISSTVKMLLEDDATSSSLRPDLERINRSVEMCQTIRSNVLDLAKANTMKMVPHDIHESLKSAVALYRPMLDSSLIAIEEIFDPSLPRVEASPSHLERVFLNLLSNARGAMKSGGKITVRTERFKPVESADASWVKIVFEDNGPGLSSDMLTKLFKPFNTTKERNGGTGLGLYISREIVSKHNGFLSGENRTEGGARFSILLPISPASEPAKN